MGVMTCLAHVPVVGVAVRTGAAVPALAQSASVETMLSSAASVVLSAPLVAPAAVATSAAAPSAAALPAATVTAGPIATEAPSAADPARPTPGSDEPQLDRDDATPSNSSGTMSPPANERI